MESLRGFGATPLEARQSLEQKLSGALVVINAYGGESRREFFVPEIAARDFFEAQRFNPTDAFDRLTYLDRDTVRVIANRRSSAFTEAEVAAESARRGKDLFQIKVERGLSVKHALAYLETR